LRAARTFPDPVSDIATQQPAPRRRTQQERRAETERRLLDAAAALLARGGASAVTLAEIGRVAGYSRGIVTHQFGSRAGLLAAFAEVAQERVEPDPDQPAGVERLLALARAYVDLVTAGDDYSRGYLLLWAESMRAAPEVREIFAERDRRLTEEILEDLAAGQATGEVRGDLDLEATAAVLVGQLRGLSLQLILSDAGAQPAGLKAALAQSIARSVAG
jgi:AcrR family transcriptional regulator